jgi:hypothetical protein
MSPTLGFLGEDSMDQVVGFSICPKTGSTVIRKIRILRNFILIFNCILN